MTNKLAETCGLEKWVPLGEPPPPPYLSWKSNQFQNSHQVSKHEFVPLMKNQYIIERREKPKTNCVAAEVGIRGPFMVNLIKRKLLSSALSRQGGWVGVLLVHRAGGVSKRILRGGGGDGMKKGDEGWQGTGDTVGQYWGSYFQYVFIYMSLRTPAHCDESRWLLTLVSLHFKAAVFYKVVFLIKMSRFRVINCLFSCTTGVPTRMAGSRNRRGGTKHCNEISGVKAWGVWFEFKLNFSINWLQGNQFGPGRAFIENLTTHRETCESSSLSIFARWYIHPTGFARWMGPWFWNCQICAIYFLLNSKCLQEIKYGPWFPRNVHLISLEKMEWVLMNNLTT